MSIIYIKGDLLKSDCEVIIHSCNCFNIFGAGIAAQIRAVYPEAYNKDCMTIRGDHNKLGTYSWVRCYSKNPEYSTKIVCNLYGQYKYGRENRHTDYEAVSRGLEKIKEHFERFQEFPKIGLPYKMGCNLGGGDWKVIEAIINSVFNDKDVYVYQFDQYAP